MVKEAFTKNLFDEESRLLDRFIYCFIFLDNSNDQKALPRLYRETAFDGYSSFGNEDWITTSIVKSVDSPNFSDKDLEETLDTIGKYLEKSRAER